MLSASCLRPSGVRRRKASAVLALPVLLLSLALAGCTTASPEADDPPAQPTGGTSAPQGESPSADAPPTESPTAGGAPGTGSPPEDGKSPGPGDPTAEDDPADPADPSSTAWQEPADPAKEGPTAAPALPEVTGSLDEVIALPTHVMVSLSSIETTTIEASTPGEYSGSAVVVSVTIANETTAPLPVSSAVVSLGADDGEIGVPTWAEPHDPLQGEVPAGSSAVGTYVFMLEPADGRSVTVSVNYSAGEPVAVFTGGTP